jgi:cytochrome b561
LGVCAVLDAGRGARVLSHYGHTRGGAMLLGIAIKGWMLAVGGGALFALLVFQVLQGTRKIKFKGALHLKVHKAVALAMLLLAVFHALAALAFLGII